MRKRIYGLQFVLSRRAAFPETPPGPELRSDKRNRVQKRRSNEVNATNFRDVGGKFDVPAAFDFPGVEIDGEKILETLHDKTVKSTLLMKYGESWIR